MRTIDQFRGLEKSNNSRYLGPSAFLPVPAKSDCAAARIRPAGRVSASSGMLYESSPASLKVEPIDVALVENKRRPQSHFIIRDFDLPQPAHADFLVTSF